MIGAAVRVLIVVLLGLAPGASAIAQGPDAVFDRANEAYAAGRYSEAADGYLELARLGVEHLDRFAECDWVIEAIARQYITGSMWRAYEKGERNFLWHRTA